MATRLELVKSGTLELVYIDRRLTRCDVAVYGVLLHHLWKDDTTVWPSRETIANKCG